MIHPGAKPVGLTATEPSQDESRTAIRLGHRRTAGTLGLAGPNVRASPSPSGGGHPRLDEDPPDISAKAASEPRVASAGILGGAGTLFANARRYCASYYYAEEWKGRGQAV